jgi:hypothetical protein
MSVKKSTSRIVTCLLIFVFLSISTLPAQAESFASPLYASGNFLWAKSMSGANSEIGMAVVVDSSGNVYTTGNFRDTVDFDPGEGIFNLTGAGDNSNFYECKIDIFVSKVDSNGNFVWAKRMGGTDHDTGTSIAVDSTGSIYITGYFTDTVDFDPSTDTYNLTSLGFRDIFVSKLDSNGNFIWAKSMGNTDYDEGYNIALDSNDNVYTTGYFIGTVDFDPGIEAFNLTSAGSNDIFVSKLDSDGNFVWAKNMGGTGNDLGYGIATDSNNNIYTTGRFQLTADFNPGTGTTNLTSAGNDDIFVSKLNTNGNFVWAKSMGGSTSGEQGNSIAVDASGNVYTTGSFFNGTADFDPGAGTANLTSAGWFDTFISKLDSNGNFAWAKRIGGSLYDEGYDIAVDSSGNVYTTGYFSFETVDFDPDAGIANLNNAGSEDIFISKLDSSGNFVWAKGMGGTGGDIGRGIALSSSDDFIYTTGYYQEITDFDPEAGIFNLTAVGAGDIYISKLGDVDAVLPNISSSVRASTSPTNLASINFIVTFSENVTGVDIEGPQFDDFALTTSPSITGASITSVSGSGKTYTVTVNTGSGNGTIRLDVPDTSTITDPSGNLLGSLPFTSGEAYTIDKIAPAVSSIRRDVALAAVPFLHPA